MTVEFSANLLATLGRGGTRLAQELALHLAKPPSKATRGLASLEKKIHRVTAYREFDTIQRQIAVQIIQAYLCTPSDNSPGRRRGSGSKPAHRTFALAVPQTRTLLEEKGAELHRNNARRFAAELASSEEWLRRRPEVRAIPLARRITAIENGIIDSASDISRAFWAKEMKPGQGHKGEIAMTRKLFELGKTEMSPQSQKTLFGDPDNPDPDGRDTPLDAAARSYAVQRSKRRRKKPNSAD